MCDPMFSFHQQVIMNVVGLVGFGFGLSSCFDHTCTYTSVHVFRIDLVHNKMAFGLIRGSARKAKVLVATESSTTSFFFLLLVSAAPALPFRPLPGVLGM